MIESKNAVIINSIDGFISCTLNYILTLIVTAIVVYVLNKVSYCKIILLGKLTKKIGIPKRLNLNNNNLINRAKNAFSNSISKVKKFFKVSS